MKLADFLKKNKHNFPPDGTIGVESDWLDTGESLDVTTGSLWAGDPYICNAEDGCVVKVPAGVYVLQAKCMDFAGRKCVSRVRVVLKETSEPVVGKRVGETQTDIGSMAVCDIVALDEAIDDDNDQFQELIIKKLTFKDCGVVRFKMKKPIALPYISTGFGDGVAPVFALRTKRRVVGMELEFLPSRYAFSDSDEG